MVYNDDSVRVRMRLEEDIDDVRTELEDLVVAMMTLTVMLKTTLSTLELRKSPFDEEKQAEAEHLEEVDDMQKAAKVNPKSWRRRLTKGREGGGPRRNRASEQPQ